MPKLKFNGYYFCLKLTEKKTDSDNYILRFYEKNNEVIGVTISQNDQKKWLIFANYFPNDSWFNQNYERKGNYKISGDQISFECGNVIYKGTILDDKLSLFSHSNINGFEATRLYKFIPFDILNDIRSLETNNLNK